MDKQTVNISLEEYTQLVSIKARIEALARLNEDEIYIHVDEFNAMFPEFEIKKEETK